jgi:hypothetical protein
VRHEHMWEPGEKPVYILVPELNVKNSVR